MFLRILISVSLLLLTVASVATVAACPFCTAVSQTFGEEFSTVDVVCIATLCEPESGGEQSPENDRVKKSKFRVNSVIKGDKLIAPNDEFVTLFYGDPDGKEFLVTGVSTPEIQWSTPLQVNDHIIEYLKKIPELKPEGTDRIRYFLDFLEDKEELIARDSYDEFAKAPYANILELKDDIKHDHLIEWIKSDEVPITRKRLYYVMLGVCGSEKDLPLLEQLMQSENRLEKGALDAMVACYLTLKGESGLELVSKLFIANKKSEYSDTYAAVTALRFHGDEGRVIQRDKILPLFRLILDRPEIADLVIADLARWEDWGVAERLIQMFKDATPENNWIRVPVVNYLRSAPMNMFKEQIEELQAIDPAAVKRAFTFFPNLEADETDEEEDSESEELGDRSDDDSEGQSEEKVSSDTGDCNEIQSGEEVESKLFVHANSSQPPQHDGKQSEGLNPQFVSTVSFEAPLDVTSKELTDIGQSQVQVESQQPLAANMKAVARANSVSNQVAVACPLSLLFGLPLVSSSTLFLFMWLVISGRFDRLGM